MTPSARALLALCSACAFAACASEPILPAGETPDAGLPANDAGLLTQELNLVFVHGVHKPDDERRIADLDLKDLETEVLARLPAAIDTYRTQRPGYDLVVHSHRVNLYTNAAGTLPSPSIDSASDGTGVPTANTWRSQLVAKINAAFPQEAKNLVLIGHSCGGRVSFEVAANVGGAGAPGSRDWGLQDRIAGVVSLHGAIDKLESYRTSIGVGYLTGCPAPLFGQEQGWCEYSGYISAIPAADWVAENKRALMLSSWGDCGVSIWSGASDQLLPARAQASPKAQGLTMTEASGTTYLPTHGVRYGDFCHSDLTKPERERHGEAVTAAAGKILEWLFQTSPRGASFGAVNAPSLNADVWSASYPVAGPCPEGVVDGPLLAAGSCVHPGMFDGDDHPIAVTDLDVQDGDACDGSFRWRHRHSGDSHAAKLWHKATCQPESDHGLVWTLP